MSLTIALSQQLYEVGSIITFLPGRKLRLGEVKELFPVQVTQLVGSRPGGGPGSVVLCTLHSGLASLVFLHIIFFSLHQVGGTTASFASLNSETVLGQEMLG